MSRSQIDAYRARAYGRIVRVLHDIAPAKLHAAELDLFRDTADALMFGDAGADAALADAYSLARDLVSSGRWTSERAARLLHDLRACGAPGTSGLPEAA
jgi:hypothetical protein